MKVARANDNPTRRLIAEAVAAGARDVALDCNPAFIALSATLSHGAVGDLVVSFETTPAMSQGNDVVSGGMLAAMLDNAMAISVMSALPAGAGCATVNLSISMLRAAGQGRLLAAAKVVKLGRRIAFVEAELTDDRGRVVATGTSSLAISNEA